ncbi:MAG: ornithine carbamoyltransferase [Candidatus Bathyarchaeum sp.]|nr:MAG: ornithine carbamoyltransferase [Candidatus Bathyarchaeum sp.]
MNKYLQRNAVERSFVHLITLKNWSSNDVEELIDNSLEIKTNPQDYEFCLEGKSLAMIFQKTSTRTRLSFEVAMTQLGGHSAYMDWRSTNLILADLGDETKSISGYVDAIMARVLKNSDLTAMADSSSVPVINGCDEKYHPCQIIADLVTVKENKGTLKGLKLAYIGVHNNICNSLIEGCTKAGVKITTVTPVVNEASVDVDLVDAAKGTGLYHSSLDVKAAVEDCDVVYTDTWVDMEFFLDSKFKKEKEKRIKTMLPYQVNKKLMKGNDGALIMHDMPIHRGYEISAEIINSPNSVIYTQSENRLHSAKAILAKLLG